MTAQLDPIVVSVAWNSLLSITEEMGSTIRRTAYSEAVREGDDFSTGLFDRQGRLISQGNYSPGHLGAMPYLVGHVLKRFPAETFVPGDAVLVNDSFLGTGHFPDIFMVTPAFWGKTLVGFAVNTAHHVDVGGAAPGSQVVDGVTDAVQEGLRILPIKLVRGGEFDPDLMQLILGNVRIPSKVEGDLRAQRNANFVGVQRLVKLYESLGETTVEACIEDILQRSETRLRELLRQIPNGKWSFEDHLDDYGQGTEPIKVAVDLTVNDGMVVVDFSRSSDQVAAGINSYINYTRAYAGFAVRVMAGALMPQNHGTIKLIDVVAREGSFFNPVYPAPSGGRAVVQIRIYEAVAGAMSQALPSRAMAGFSHWSNPNIGGIDPTTGKRFIMYDLLIGGYGARPDSDGTEALSPVFNCANIPVEVHELNNPVRIRRFEFVPDSGGAGVHRGGSAVRKEVELLCDVATLSLLGDRHRFAPYGIAGGEQGSLATTALISDGVERQLPSKGVLSIKRGDVVRYQVSGGGGYGDCSKRDPKAVAADLADGFITAEYAQVHHAHPNALALTKSNCRPFRHSSEKKEIGMTIAMDTHLVPGSNMSHPVIVSGKAAEVWDDQGNRYLDLEAGPGVVSVGHCHPKVVSAIREQAGKLLQGPGRYFSPLTSGLATRISALTNDSLSRVFFANSGAEANEGAIKISFKHATKLHRTGYGVFAMEHGFHGRTSLPLSLTGNASRKKGFGPYSTFPGIVHVPAPYFYRSDSRNELDFGMKCVRAVEDAMKTRATGEMVTLIAESIICVGGVFVPPENWWPEMQALCRKHRITLIVDEVFSGWGRTGKNFAYEHWDVQPDIVTFAKAIGGGTPLGGFMATEELGMAFDEGDHFTTFGSNNQIGMAAGHAVLDILDQENLADNAAKMGQRFLDGLRVLQGKHNAIGDVRGLGLMIGVEIVKDRESKEPDAARTTQIQKAMRERGVLVSITGVHGCVLRLTPPLVITAEQVDHALEVLDEVFKGIGHA